MIRLLRAAGLALLVGGILLGLGLLVVYGPADLEPWFAVPFLTGAASGLVLTVRRPGNALGWIFLGYGATGMLNAGCYAAVTVLVTESPAEISPTVLAAAWFSQTTWILILALATVFPLLLFPEGLQSRRWRWVLWAAIGSTAILTAAAAFVPRLEDTELGISVDNPFAPSWLDWVPADPEDSPLANAAFTTLGVCVLVAAVGLLLRFRRARGVERQQLRWFALAGTLMAIAIALDELFGESYGNTAFANAFLPLTLAFIPVACGIAITRHGLYEIDRLLSRTLSYVIVTGVVLATYALVVTSVSRLAPESSTLAVAGATLAAAAVFRPVLQRVQGVVDRRFDRARFDAAREVDQLAASLRGAADADAAMADLVVAVQRTLAPRSLGVWTRGPAS